MGRLDEEIRYIFTPETGQLDRALGRISGALKGYSTQVSQNERELGGVATQTRKAKQETDRFTRSTDRAARQQKRFWWQSRRDVARFNRQVRTGLLDEFDRFLPASLSRASVSMGLFSSKGTLALQGSVVAAGALTAAVGVGLVGAIIAAGGVVMEFRRQFIESMDAQVERVGRVQLAMQALNISRAEAQRFNQETEIAIARAGRDMPVSVADIQSFYGATGDELAEYLNSQGKALDEIRNQTVATTSRLAVVQQLSGITSGNALANIQAYLGGAGAGELRQMSLFQRNPRLLRDLQEGVRSGENRVELLIQALNDYVSDDMLRDLQGTTRAQWSAFMDRMFDPTIGLFSITRDIDNDVSNGYQTVAAEFGESVRLIFGQDGLVDQVVAAFNLIDRDPMVELRNQVIKFNEFLEELTVFFQKLDTARNSNRLLDQSINFIGDTFTKTPYEQIAQRDQPGLLWRLFGAKAQPQFTGSLSGLGNTIGSMPLLDAIAAEIANKPANSDLVIANTSEVVLTQAQLGQLMSGRGKRAAGPITINIYQQPGQDAHGLAREVMELINEQYETDQDSIL